ncbi:hypothetical protein ACQ4M3_30135 [Leptolyngbya sp. AN03gr2]|uniref:hypothetical protein n=1 Tax=unclassified Leptolyngbya TaxID=2650499 RepID=UPI003D3219BF
MTVQQITIELPEPIFRQFARIAEATHQPIEALIAQSVMSNLPPSPDSAAPEVQPELLRMQTLSTEDLTAIAQAQTDSSQYDRHTELLEKNAATTLTPEERQELSTLRQTADSLMLRKAYAWSLLRWRGQAIPALKELPLPQ